MNSTNKLTKNRVNSVHLGGWLIIDRVEQLEFGARTQVAVRGEIHAQKPPHAQVSPCDTSYPVLFTGETANIVLAWAQVRKDHPVKMTVDGRLLRKGAELVVLVRYVEVQEIITGPLTAQEEATRPTPRRH